MPAPKQPRASDEVVRRARVIYSRGYGFHEVAEHLRDEGHDFDRATVAKWCKWETRQSAGGPYHHGSA